MDKIDLEKEYVGTPAIQIQQMIKECALKINEIVDYINKNEQTSTEKSPFPNFR